MLTDSARISGRGRRLGTFEKTTNFISTHDGRTRWDANDVVASHPLEYRHVAADDTSTHLPMWSVGSGDTELCVSFRRDYTFVRHGLCMGSDAQSTTARVLLLFT